MSMSDWAKKEIALAKERERKISKEFEESYGDALVDYGEALFDSALKAFNSLMEDGHSGMSIKLTQQILNRLIDGKPLFPIEDTDDIWVQVAHNKKDNIIIYQCKRMSSLFKHLYEDGRIVYSDIDRFYCFNRNEPDSTYTSGLSRDIIDEMFPITMPYSPKNERIKVCCEQFLYSPDGGDFDSVGILYVEDPDNKAINVSRYFKEEDNKWVEIEVTEYFDRVQTYLAREGRVTSSNIKNEPSQLLRRIDYED